MAQEPVHYQTDGGGEGRTAAKRSVPRWWRGPDPDPVEICRLYVQENRTETEIAVMLSVSRARVTAILRDAGIPRRDPRKNCPVDPDTLRERVRAGATATSVAREHGVSHSTAARWLAEAGLLGADPKADTQQLVGLYVHRRLTTREVAAELGISKGRVIQALAAAGHSPPAAVGAPSPRRSRRGHRHGVGRGLPPAGCDNRAGGNAFRGQRGVPAAPGRRGRVDQTPRHVRPAVGLVAGCVAGPGREAVRDGDDHARGGRPARGVHYYRQHGAARRQGSRATRRRDPTGSPGSAAHVDQ